jgi:hypothetical protein
MIFIVFSPKILKFIEENKKWKRRKRRNWIIKI